MFSDTHSTGSGGSSPDDASRTSGPSRVPVEDVLRTEKLRYMELDARASVSIGDSVASAIERLSSLSTSAVIVLDKDSQSALGIFTERDYLDKIAGDASVLERPVEEFMTASPAVVSSNDTIDHAIQMMTEGGYRHLPVVESDAAGNGSAAGRVVGLVSTQDIINYLAEFFPVEIYNLPPDLGKTVDTREGG